MSPDEIFPQFSTLHSRHLTLGEKAIQREQRAADAGPRSDAGPETGPETGPDAGPDAGPGPARVVARGDSGHGEVALRRRGEVLELVVDGVFAMDSAHPDSEIALAGLALDRLARRAAPSGRSGTAGPHSPSGREGTGSAGWRVLVGGLGLGFTAAAVLADPRVGELVVVELQPLLVGWVRDGLVPSAAGLLDDARVQVTVGDIGPVVAGLPKAGLDAVLLDVDNGPAFLVHERNATLYRPSFLSAAMRALVPGGVLAIWSADPAPGLLATLGESGGDRPEEVLFDVERDGRRFSYAVYLAERPS